MEFRVLVTPFYNGNCSNDVSGLIIDRFFKFERIKEFYNDKYLHIFLVDGCEIGREIGCIEKDKIQSFLEIVFNIENLLDLKQIMNLRYEQKIRELEKENRDLIERLSFHEEEC